MNEILTQVQRISNWLINSDSLLTISVVAGSVTAGLASMIFLPEKIREWSIANRYKALDARPSQIFSCVADCEAKGFSHEIAEQSWQEAQRIDRKTIYSFRYRQEEECRKYHSKYHLEQASADDGMGNSYRRDFYYADIVGWQTAVDNPLRAVPLYADAEPGKAIRLDGMKFNLP